MADCAPYLVHLTANSPALETLVQASWGKGWGIYLTSMESLKKIRRHLRRLLIVQTEDKRKLYFRFYDPLILNLFLPSCVSTELSRMFGPVSTYWTEDGCADVLRELTFKDSKLYEKRRKLNEHSGCGPGGIKPEESTYLSTICTRTVRITPMLTIRNEQMAIFLDHSEKEFAKRLAYAVRDCHANVVVRLPQGPCRVAEIPIAALCTIVQEGIHRAKRYGMSYETSFSDFIALMFIAAPNFDDHSQIRDVLSDPALVPDLRMDFLWGRISDETWTEIENSYNPSAWGKIDLR